MNIEESKQYIRERISELRSRKGVSEYRMSLDMGHSKGYIQGISSGKALPTMEGFLRICEYLDVSAADFFNPEKKDPASMKELDCLAEKLPPEKLWMLICFAGMLSVEN